VLSPERCRGLPSRRVRVRVGLRDTLDAARRLALPRLERVGWVLPQEGGPHMLVECVRGVEEPAPAPAPAEEEVAVVENGSTEGGARPNATPTTPPGEEKTEATAAVALAAIEGFKLPPAPAFMFNPELLHAASPKSRALASLSVANTPLLRTPAHTPARTPVPTRPTTPTPSPVQVPLKKPKKAPLPPPLQPRERKLTDEWTLSMHWPVGHSWPPAEIEEVFPVGEVVGEVYN
jgi:hypothetical protein